MSPEMAGTPRHRLNVITSGEGCSFFDTRRGSPVGKRSSPLLNLSPTKIHQFSNPSLPSPPHNVEAVKQHIVHFGCTQGGGVILFRFELTI